MILGSKTSSVAASSSAAARVTRPANNQGNAIPARKILVVDDDPITLKALSLKLKSKGYDVVTAIDSSQAFNAMQSEKPDLTLMDVNFPPDMGGVDWNGFRITQWLRRVEDAKDMPFIVISSSERTDYKRRASALGAAAFLPKSVNGDGLVACINLALSKKDAAKSTAAPAADPSGSAPAPGNASASAASKAAQPGELELGIL